MLALDIIAYCRPQGTIQQWQKTCGTFVFYLSVWRLGVKLQALHITTKWEMKHICPQCLFCVSWPWSDRKSSMVCNRKDRWRTDRPGLPMRRDAYTSSCSRRICTAAQPRWVPGIKGRDKKEHTFTKVSKTQHWHLPHSYRITLVLMLQDNLYEYNVWICTYFPKWEAKSCKILEWLSTTPLHIFLV